MHDITRTIALCMAEWCGVERACLVRRWRALAIHDGPAPISVSEGFSA
jgi:hypothetical protein